MQIYPAEKIREWDAYTIAHEPIASIDLMERASKRFVEAILPLPHAPIHIFAGVSNNGGDGLAVARILLEKGHNVQTSIVWFSDKASEDFKINRARLEAIREVHHVRNADDFPTLSPQTTVIDAIFGSGLSRPASGFTADLIRYINASGNTVLSIDIPSGLYVDTPNAAEDAIVRATATYTFQCAKAAFLMAENDVYVGRWRNVDIGLHPDFPKQHLSSTSLFGHEEAKTSLLPRPAHGHKGTFGHGLLIGGSYGKMGAMVLAMQGMLRSGIGLSTCYVPRCGYAIMQTRCPEAMCLTDDHEQRISDTSIDLKPFKAIGIGPGLGTHTDTVQYLHFLLPALEVPAVFDADAINIIAEDKHLLDKLPAGSILTPHPGEFARLVDNSVHSFEALEKAKHLAQTYKIIIVLKGAYTAVVTPDGQISFNASGNAGMATGGSGDTLTGIITGLLAQGYAPESAARLGVYLHGKAGDKAKEAMGEHALTASDISRYLGKVFMELG